MKSISIITLLLLLFASCSKETKKHTKFSLKEIASLKLDSTLDLIIKRDSIVTFNLNPLLKDRSFNFGEMIKTIKFLPLETNNENLISEIQQVLVTDSNIYICNDRSLNNVLIFDIDGKYMKQIRYGEGPKDILQLKGVAYDDGRQELIVYHNKFLSFFTKDGDFKKRESVPLNARYFALIDDGYLFYAVSGIDNTHLGYPENYQILMTDKFYHLKSKGYPYRFSEKNNYGGNNPLGVNHNQLTIGFNFVDTIYRYIDNRTIKANYAFDISDKKIPDELLFDGSIDEFFKETERNDYNYFVGEYVESDTHVFIAFQNGFTTFRSDFFIDKRTKNIRGGTRLEYDAANFPCLSSPVTSMGSYYVSYVQPQNILPRLKLLKNKFISDEDIAKLSQLREDDNPVLIFYELASY